MEYNLTGQEAAFKENLEKAANTAGNISRKLSIEVQEAAFKAASTSFVQENNARLNDFKNQSSASLKSDAQQASFGALGNQIAGLRRIRIAGMIAGAAQSAAFLSKLDAIERNEPITLTQGDLLTKHVSDRLILSKPNTSTNPDPNYSNELSIEIPECVVSVVRERQIVKTFLKGKEGSHKQFLQNGDFIISVVGKFVKKGHTYPLAQLYALNEILSSDVALDYQSRFLFEVFKFTKVVCDGRPKFFQISGVENEYGFEFTLVSD